MRTDKIVGIAVMMMLIASLLAIFVFADEIDDLKQEVLKERDRLFADNIKEIKRLLAARNDTNVEKAEELIKLLKASADEYRKLDIALTREQIAAIVDVENLLENPPTGFFSKLGNGAYNVGTSWYTYILIAVLAFSVIGIFKRGKIAEGLGKGSGWLWSKTIWSKRDAARESVAALKSMREHYEQYAKLRDMMYKSIRNKEKLVIVHSKRIKDLNAVTQLLKTRAIGEGQVYSLIRRAGGASVKIRDKTIAPFKLHVILAQFEKVNADIVEDIKNMIIEVGSGLHTLRNSRNELQKETDTAKKVSDAIKTLPNNLVCKQQLNAKLEEVINKLKIAEGMIAGTQNKIKSIFDDINKFEDEIYNVSKKVISREVIQLDSAEHCLEFGGKQLIEKYFELVDSLNRRTQWLQQIFETKEIPKFTEFAQKEQEIRTRIAENGEIDKMLKEVESERVNLEKLRRVALYIATMRNHMLKRKYIEGDNVRDINILTGVTKAAEKTKKVVPEISLREFKDILDGKFVEQTVSGVTIRFKITVEEDGFKFEPVR